MNTYEIVTERITNLLKQGVIPWRRPWSAAGAPRNLVSKKVYRGVNVFLLSATKYVSPFWLTMRQANQLGGSVRKDEHSQIVVFWKVDQNTAAKEEPDPEKLDADGKSRRRFVLRYYRTWNLEQCDLPQTVLDKLPKIETFHHDPIKAAERIIAGMPNPPEIQYAGSSYETRGLQIQPELLGVTEIQAQTRRRIRSELAAVVYDLSDLPLRNTGCPRELVLRQARVRQEIPPSACRRGWPVQIPSSKLS